MSEDPLTNLPPVPHAAPPPVPLGDLGRHATYQPVEPVLLAPSGDPLPPTAGPAVKRNGGMPATHASVAAVGQDVADIDSRVAALEGRSHPSSGELLIVGVLAALALAVAIIALVFALGARNTLYQMGAHQTASDIRHAQSEDALQTSQCTTLAAMRRTYSTAGRNAWPSGGGDYDTYYAALAQAATSAGCGR